ncbi:hypothetical protein Aduo_012921 [Ancylostoma duodenale]
MLLIYIFHIDGISMGNFTREARYRVKQDLGTWIIAPQDIVVELARAAGAYYEGRGAPELDCDARFPDLKITAGSTVYTVKDTNLNVKYQRVV